ncbi:MAG TPA: cell division protein FtsZ [Candidatus Tyrphobacter sp.]|nr:cell division protein FtsZ [Candidatus Tyrphobacter sp.]
MAKTTKKNTYKAKSAFTDRPIVKIKVVGVGGAGGNAVTRMSDDFVRGVDLIAVNTDIQDLETCLAKKKIHIGQIVTRGMGAGMNPDLGRQAAEESRQEIAEALMGADMVFITAGFGGGTGTGAAPVVAEVAKEVGALTVAVVTKPFAFEGQMRLRIAEEGIIKIKDKVDTLIIIPNDRIFSVVDNDTPVLKAFEKIDEILKSAVQGVAEIITSSGLVNVDFADIRAIMAGTGSAIIGVGISSGNDRAAKAATQAITSPLLESSVEGATGILFGIAGGRDLKIREIDEIAKLITENVDPGAKIIFGAYHDRKLKAGQLKVTLIATGFHRLMRREGIEPLNLFSLRQAPVESRIRVEPKKDSEIKKSGEEEEPKETKAKEDELDIPAFLRRRKR